MEVNDSLGLWLPPSGPSGPSGSGCLTLEGDGLKLANSVLSFVLCAVLVVSCVRAFRVVAIPQSGLLAQISSLWFHSGHSGSILVKQFSLCLPAQAPLASGGCRHLHCFSAGGVTIGLVICGFKLFIYFSSLLCCSLCFQGLPQTWQWECFLVFGNFSLFKTPFLGWSSLPTSFASFFVFYIFSYLFSKTMSCFSGCLMSSAGIQKLYCGICSALKCSFDEFVGEKLVSPSYPSAILGPLPNSLILLMLLISPYA